MRVLLSTIGSRGDVQPMLALAVHLRDVGHDARLCAGPNFADLVAGHGVAFVPVGHDLRQGPLYVPGGPAQTVADQFEALREAANDCDVIIGCAAMQIAAHSIAEMLGIPYYYAAYAPVALPSRHHSPLPVYGQTEPDDAAHLSDWERDALWWNNTWRDGLNAQRAAVGLEPVSDVRSYVISDRPLLAADPTLAPWPIPAELDVVQTGAWLLTDRRPLSREVESFLDAGEPPIYFGFGSMLVHRASGPTMLAAARALGRRAIVMRGYESPTSDDSPDWLAVEETNQQALFTRVAAVVHHGGSGTTTVAARAGTPQLVIPHHYDQPYYAQRVATLGVGTAHSGEPTADSLAEALGRVLSPAVVERAGALAAAVRTDGTAVAAREILGHSGLHEPGR